jgi:hypothetical protein
MVAHPGEQGAPRAARRLNEPRPAAVEAVDGRPVTIGNVPVATVREEWRVSERWWTGRPLRRRYFDAVLETGENVVVFLEELEGRWYRQRA